MNNKDISEQAAKIFEGKIILRNGKLENYLKKYPGKFPEPPIESEFKNQKPGMEKNAQSQWERIATQIKFRNFSENPIDDSTRQSLIVGLRSIRSTACKEAVEKLEQIKTASWGKKDLKAGKLLPRNKKGKQNDHND